MIHLNHAGTSWPKPIAVQQAVTAALQESPDTWAASLTSQHNRVAAAFGVDAPERLLLTPGATSALSVAMADLPWEPGDRLLISAWEHHALHRPAQKLAAQGVETVVIPPTDSEPLDLEALEGELRRGGVRLVAMCAACNVTGDRLPVADIVRASHAHGALCLIDAAQVAGWLPLDIPQLGADLLVFTGHKGPQAPWGIGALYVRPGLSLQTPAAVCDITDPPADVSARAGNTGTADERLHPGGRVCAPMPGFCDVGSVDRLALAGLAAGLRWLDEPAQADRLKRARQAAHTLSQALRELPGVTLVARTPLEQRLPTVAVRLDRLDVSRVAHELLQRGLNVGAGLLCAPLAHETLGTEPQGVLRFSFGPTNAPDDAEVAAEQLRPLLSHSN